ncbi:hypothetical protein ABLE93_09695 [Xanthobacter sp. KR7-65]|uniref:hypothetical protein n=1 Tax=Xanthobacter sp. KR7-65 TaxID=3156612 RepID=UPI0032B5BAE9
MDILALAAALEGSALGVAARSSVWLYPIANICHVLGAALLVGASATFDIAVLRRERAAGWVLRAGIPVAAVGLVIQLASGLVLFAAEAGPLTRNPAFLAKLAFIAAGLFNILAFHGLFGRTIRQGPLPSGARITAALSLLAWTAALLLGRTIAYV